MTTHFDIPALRARIARLERAGASDTPSLAGAPAMAMDFGVAVIDAALPTGGLAQGAVHEVMGGGAETEHAAAACLFVAGIAARVAARIADGWSIWIGDEPPYLPALVGCGLRPAWLLFVRATTAERVLQAMEDALRSGAVAVVVGELDGRLSLTGSRRLQLAAEARGTIGLLLRRSRRFDDPQLTTPSAAPTRWRVTSAPSAAPVAGRPRLRGLSPARWRVELLRNRGGVPHEWLMEQCDAQGRLRLVPDLRDRPAASLRTYIGRAA